VTLLALALLLLASTAPLLGVPLRHRYSDPTVLVAGATVLLLALAALAAALAGSDEGWSRAAALVLGVAVATTGGSEVVRATFRLVRGDRRVRRRPRPVRAAEVDAPGPADVPDAADAPDVQVQPGDRPAGEVTSGHGRLEPSLETVLRGGVWIGYLERAAISATLLAGWPEGMALVLAVKGVGRYPELKAPSTHAANAPEAFIIGTLVSVLWAAAAAGSATLLTP
jgi:hypothetical protein